VGLVARLFFASASITNAIYRSMIESSLSTDSEVEIVSMKAIGMASSLPLFDGGGAYCFVVARIVLVVGPSNSSGTVILSSGGAIIIVCVGYPTIALPFSARVGVSLRGLYMAGD
jgi:hypothetical protein